MTRHSQFDPRRGTDALYDQTAADAEPPCAISRRELTCVSGALIWLALLLIVLATGARVVDRTVDNWMNGYGFTPITPTRTVAPASWTPASVTWVQPAEAAQR